MNVLIVGSFQAKPEENVNLADLQLFNDVCNKLGEQLTNAQHHILVGSNFDCSAAAPVVKGACTTKNNFKPRITLLQRKTDIQVQSPKSSNPGTIQIVPLTSVITELKDKVNLEKIEDHWPDTGTSRLLLVQKADAIILIGGGGAVSEYYYFAIHLKKPVVVVPCFGGFAATVFEGAKAFYDRMGTNPSIIDKLSVHNAESITAAAIDMSMSLKRNMDTHLNPDWKSLVTLLFSTVGILACWYLSVKYWNTTDSLMALGRLNVLVFLSGLCGLILRIVFQNMHNVNYRFALKSTLFEVLGVLVLSFFFVLMFASNSKYYEEHLKATSDVSAILQSAQMSLSLTGLALGLLLEQAMEIVREVLGKTFGKRDDKSS